MVTLTMTMSTLEAVDWRHSLRHDRAVDRLLLQREGFES